ncbi:A20/AN1-like zinc finger family protein [Actinidia rufa]|uniref:A20/AN1-like zinc finger family protein n=1 Tax=Actinidia rufa TaxID=165716 RepID=A0A7J0FP74_9ERIC|nr:A20/AN1-like zinc finger family protein [Actinidia rufa]
MAQRTEKEETEFKVVPETITAVSSSSSSVSGGAIATPPFKFSAGDCAKSRRSTSSSTPGRNSCPAETRRCAAAASREVNRCCGCQRKGRADGIPVPMRRSVLRGAPVLRPPRLQLRLQNRRARSHREGESGG